MPDHFADQAADWDSRPLPQQISAGVSAALLARVPLRADQTVLDFGVGTGLIAARVAPRVSSVVALDVSPAMLEQLAARPELRGRVEPLCQDILQSPLDRRFDVVVSAMALHHVERTAALLRALHDHLAPGGWIALADLDLETGDFHQAGIEGVFHRGFDRAALAAALREAGFAEVAIETACVVEKEGRSYPIFLATAIRPMAQAD